MFRFSRTPHTEKKRRSRLGLSTMCTPSPIRFAFVLPNPEHTQAGSQVGHFTRPAGRYRGPTPLVYVPTCARKGSVGTGPPSWACGGLLSRQYCGERWPRLRGFSAVAGGGRLRHACEEGRECDAGSSLCQVRPQPGRTRRREKSARIHGCSTWGEEEGKQLLECSATWHLPQSCPVNEETERTAQPTSSRSPAAEARVKDHEKRG